ncbi:hypothetical protein PI124_g23937 [Phytophthora idaei]|nr:hypothetical protein PI124_g23937 [Phytophthora idaei]
MCLLIAQLLLQLGELPTLELFQSGYTIVQSAGVTVDRTRGIFPPPPPPLRDARGSTRWIVERIVGYEPPKTNRDQARLRIRWRGFPPHRDTWEPRNVLIEDVPEMVREYEAQNGVQA